MRTERRSPQAGNRSRRSAAAKATPKPTRQTQALSERDPFLEIQAESGRRMRPIVADHYGEIE